MKWFIVGFIVAIMLLVIVQPIAAQNLAESVPTIGMAGTNSSQLIVGMGNITDSYLTVEWWQQLPGPPLNFTITQTGPSSINITWDMGANADTVIIRVKEDGYPKNVTDGYFVYAGNGTSTTVDGLNLDTTTYYYRAWSHNGYGYSVDYAQAQIGGVTMIFISFVLMAMGMMTLFVWKRIGLFSFGAAGVWALLAFLGFQQSGAGAPIPITDVYMGVFWIGVAFTIICAFLPMIMREKPDPDDVYIDDFDEVTGQLTGRHKRGDKPQDEPLKRKKPIPSSFSMTGK
jgi:hypothetical protein